MVRKKGELTIALWPNSAKFDFGNDVYIYGLVYGFYSARVSNLLQYVTNQDFSWFNGVHFLEEYTDPILGTHTFQPTADEFVGGSPVAGNPVPYHLQQVDCQAARVRFDKCFFETNYTLKTAIIRGVGGAWFNSAIINSCEFINHGLRNTTCDGELVSLSDVTLEGNTAFYCPPFLTYTPFGNRDQTVGFCSGYYFGALNGPVLPRAGSSWNGYWPRPAYGVANRFEKFHAPTPANLVPYYNVCFSCTATTEPAFNPCISPREANKIAPKINSLEFEIIPNPANREISLLNFEKGSNAKIFNNLGQLIFNNKMYQNSIDISLLEQGIYILRINNISRKFIKLDSN